MLNVIFLDIKNILISENEINQKMRNSEKVEFSSIDKRLLNLVFKIKEVDNSRIVLMADKSSLIDERSFRLNLDDGFSYLYNNERFNSIGKLIDSWIKKNIFLSYKIISQENNEKFLAHQLRRLSKIKGLNSE